MQENQHTPEDTLSRLARDKGGILVLFFLGALLVARIPAITLGAEINRDESQMLAQAMRYGQDLVPWRAVDGTTSGPVNSWFLLGAHKLGLKLGYQAAHALASLALALTLGCLFVATKRHLRMSSATVAIAIATVWLAVNQGPDFVHYSSEVVPLLLISAALAAGEGGLTRRLAGAALLGLAPWAKLQAGPIAAVVGLWLLYTTHCAVKTGSIATSRWVAVLLLGLAATMPSLLIVAAIYKAGALSDFIGSYFTANLHYAGPLKAKSLAIHLARFVSVESVAPWLLVVMGVFAIAFRGVQRQAERIPSITWFGVILLLASLLVCARSQTFFPHYQMLLIPGLFLCTASVVWMFERVGAKPVAFAALAIAVFVSAQIGDALRGVRNLRQMPRPSAASRIVREVRQVAPELHSICIWGWAPAIYVELQATPPTRHAICHYLIEPSPSREFLRAGFMKDLRASMPTIILDLSDAVTGKAEDKSVASFTDLQAFLREHYEAPRHVVVPDVVVDEGGDLRAIPVAGAERHLDLGPRKTLELSVYVRRAVATARQ